jgi:23S rRNA (uracil-5-)-methyltransferase RumA
MDFMFGWRGELGLKEAGKWWSVVDLPKCFLQSEEANEILRRVSEWSKKSDLLFWDNKKQTGFLRALVIREGKNTGERLVMLVTAESEMGVDISVVDKNQRSPVIRRQPNDWREIFLDLFEDGVATSVLCGISRRATDLSIADEIVALNGKPWLHEEINGLKYRIAPNSFFQTNSEMAAELQNTVTEFVAPKPEQKIADLYCGAGFFSLAFARAGAEVVGVEMDKAGIEAAKVNAELNAIKADFFAAKIEDYFKDKNLAVDFDTVVLDPPRAGLHPKVLETLIEVLPQKIIYVSCNYNNLAKELPNFLQHYKISRIRALDLFPQTPHVEVVIELEKK